MANTKTLLQQHDLRVTPVRLSVLKVLEQAKAPMDIQNIWDTVKQESVASDQATIYRTIETFLDKGLIKQIDFREGKYRYELNDAHHHHLMCQSCGNVTPIYDGCLSVDEAKIRQEFGFVVSDHSLEFFGTCQQCYQEQA